MSGSFIHSSCLFKLFLHRGITASELLDAQIFRVIVSQAKIVLRAEEIILHLLVRLDGLVNLFNGLVEFFAGFLIVTGEFVTEGIDLVLKVGNIHTLLASQNEFLLVLNALLGCLGEE